MVQKFPKNLQAKLGTVYKPKVALVSGRKRSGHTETHVNVNAQVPACLRLAGNPIMPAAVFPAHWAQADFGRVRLRWDSQCQQQGLGTPLRQTPEVQDENLLIRPLAFQGPQPSKVGPAQIPDGHIAHLSPSP